MSAKSQVLYPREIHTLILCIGGISGSLIGVVKKIWPFLNKSCINFIVIIVINYICRRYNVAKDYRREDLRWKITYGQMTQRQKRRIN